MVKRGVFGLLLLVEACSTASMNIHSLTADRAVKYYAGVSESLGSIPTQLNKVIYANPNSVYAGADFPDFMYACNANFSDHHNEGEAAHWPPFHAVSVRYLQNLPDFNNGNASAWSEDTQQLAAFIFGLTVHYVTDENWEGLTPQLGSGWGFIESVDYLNTPNNGQGDANENLGNMGGDFYTAWILNESSIKPFERKFPLKHLVEIYKQTPQSNNPNDGNFTDMNMGALVRCNALFDLGLWALKNLGPLAFETYNRVINDIPIVQERVIDMPISGVDDLASYVTFVWNRLAVWITKGVPTTELEHRPYSKVDAEGLLLYNLFQSLRPFVGQAETLRKWEGTLSPSHFEHLELKSTPSASVVHQMVRILIDVVTNTTQQVWTLAQVKGVGNSTQEADVTNSSRETEGRITAELKGGSSQVRSEHNLTPGGFPTASTFGKAAVQYYGQSIVTGDWNGDGVEDMAIGGYGFGKPGESPRSGAVEVIYGGSSMQRVTLHNVHESLGRFGWSLGSLDFNSDGVDDLVVGAPGASGWNAADVSLDSATFGPYPSSPTINNSKPVFKLTGKAFVFLGDRTVGVVTHTSAREVITISTHVPFTALATSITTGDINGDGKADILLGCPIAAFDTRVHPGRIYGLVSTSTNMAGKTIIVENSASLQLKGDEEYGWFGQSLAVVGNILVVGSPFARAPLNNFKVDVPVGKLRGFSLSSSTSTSTSTTEPHERRSIVTATKKFTVVGDGFIGEFGFSMKSTTGTLVVGAPDAGGISFGNTSTRPGMVYVINKTTLEGLPTTINASDVRWSAVIEGGVAYGRFGWSLNVLKTEKSVQLGVSAPFAGVGIEKESREKGIVYAWKTLPVGVVHVNNSTSHDTWSMAGPSDRGRMGTSFSFLSNKSIATGSPMTTFNNVVCVGRVDVFPLGW